MRTLNVCKVPRRAGSARRGEHQTAAVELCTHGITVNGVAPTVVRGEMGRVAEPEDVVGPVLFFCSPAAAFVTGQVLYLDGGLTATQ